MRNIIAKKRKFSDTLEKLGNFCKADKYLKLISLGKKLQKSWL